MAADDLVLAAIASKLITPSTITQTTTPNNPPTQSVGLTAEQLNAIANAVRSGVQTGLSNLQLPAINVAPPEVNVAPPEVNVPPAQVQFPENLRLSFSDEELAKLAVAVNTTQEKAKSSIYQRSIFIDISPTSIPSSAFVNAEFPAGIKVASFNFTQQAGLIGVTLSASLVNTFTKPCGFFAALASDNRLNFDDPYTSLAQVGQPKTPDSQVLVSVFTHQNSTALTINPNTRAAAISFGLENAVTIVNSQTTLSLYAFQTIDPATGQGQAGQLMSAILTAYYIPTE